MNYRFYLKKLTTNELGYRKGKLVTGQMFFISKYAAGFFPPLSKEINNDCINLRIRMAETENLAYLNLVYHNDKHNVHGGTRDEYRIYLNNDIAPHPHFFQPEDIVTFERTETDLYYLSITKPRSENYKNLDSIITKSCLRGNHALCTYI